MVIDMHRAFVYGGGTINRTMETEMSENKMTGDNKVWLLTALMLLVFFAIFVASLSYYEVYKDTMVADMVMSGVDPIHAKCALTTC